MISRGTGCDFRNHKYFLLWNIACTKQEVNVPDFEKYYFRNNMSLTPT